MRWTKWLRVADIAGGATTIFVSQTLGTLIDIIIRGSKERLRHANFTKDGRGVQAFVSGGVTAR